MHLGFRPPRWTQAGGDGDEGGQRTRTQQFRSVAKLLGTGTRVGSGRAPVRKKAAAHDLRARLPSEEDLEKQTFSLKGGRRVISSEYTKRHSARRCAPR